MLGHGGGNVLGDPRVRMTRPTEFTFTFSHSAPEDKKLKEDLRKDTHYIFDNMSWRKIIDKDSTSVDDLRDIVSDRWSRPRNPFDEVFPGIFLGDASAALCMSILVREGIGFVVNAADSCSRCLAGRNCGTCVRTRQAFYNVGNIQLKAIAALDEVGFPLYWYFNEATEFIDNALATGGILHDLRITSSPPVLLSTASSPHFPAKRLTSSQRTAKDVMVLKMKRIAFVINAAFGSDEDMSVNTNESFYSSRGYPCEFLGVPAVDLEVFKLHYFFKIATDFIEQALRANGKVLVHCREGISRSATLVIAYLMMKKGMTAKEAVRLVRNKRQIYPNDGFLLQLCDLDLRLRGQRKY
ncbi:unnamed protein product [Allacma fusca]|uniref:protein-serine/threonine phosphatase n=1 Tax=Allacma fusca TaxID=39272 RepID=A0A8J2LH53_9HEXA|nr:unnamed protein product [Allacma fusca]